LAELQFREKPDVILTYSESKRPIQQVQCRDRWTGCCLNKDCWAFQNINGYYYCAKNGLPTNPTLHENEASK
jgi:hypothetical protein